MPDFLANVIPETAQVFYEGSLYILVGFAIAGLLHEFLPTDLIARYMGRESPRSVGAAALFGAPLPLCSCSVLPAAAALRKKGAGRSSTMAFLISTPETGVDSIALTYGLLGGVMAIIRPIVAVVTAFVAGMLSMRAPGSDEPFDERALDELPLEGHGGEDPSQDCEDCCEEQGEVPGAAGSRDAWVARFERASRYGFVTLLDYLAFWLLMGILLTGILSAALPDDFFSTLLGLDSGILPMLVMIVVGVPLYLCASGSTPVAAALVAKGLSPGAALVFLLVGPATNATTIAVASRLLGRGRLRIYLGSIIGVSLVAGLLVDALAADTVRTAVIGALGDRGSEAPNPLKVLAALVFVGLLARSALRTRFREGIQDARSQARQLRQAVRDFDRRRMLQPAFLTGAAVVLLLVFLPSVFLVVEPGHRGLVQRFGRVVASDLQPGLHVHWPPPIGRGTSVDVERVRQVEVGRSAIFGAAPTAAQAADETYYITADENVIDVRVVLHYRVSDPVRFALGLEKSEELLRSLARQELIRIATGTSIDTLYTVARRATEETFRSAVAERVNELELGIEILDGRLLDVHAPAAVHDAFRDVASSLEDRERAIHEGNAYAAETTTEAGGEAAEVVAQALADALRARELARGTTAAFVDIAAVHARSPGVTETRLYLETLERSLAEPHKYVHGAPGNAGEVDLWIGAGGATPVELAAPEAARRLQQRPPLFEEESP